MKIIRASSPAGIKFAARALKNGGVVVFPTETVYGLGASAFNAAAVSRIFSIKGRPADNPLIVHVAARSWVKRVAREVPAVAEKLMRRFWPGPLTLVLKKNASVPAKVTAGLDTVAVRMPSHRAALALIRAAGAPIAAPSANLSGRVSPVTHAHSIADFAGRISRPDALVAGGPSRRGLESTIVDVSKPGAPRILRHGAVSAGEIAAALGVPAASLALRPTSRRRAVLAPGMKKIHYRAGIPLWVFPTAAKMEIHLLRRKPPLPPSRIFVIAPRRLERRLRLAGYLTKSFRDSADLSRKLYAVMRTAGGTRAEIIAAPLVSGGGLAAAVNDRLSRAAAKIVRD